MVDDKKEVLEPLALGLQTSGEFEVLTAENGSQALEILRSRRDIDLLITDLEMPVMDGFELLARLKKDHPATPAIVLTSCITGKTNERLKAIGDYVCIQKPVGFGELRERIIHELRSHSGQEESKE